MASKTLHIHNIKLVANDGYQLEYNHDRDTVTISETPPRYTIKKGMYSHHFFDTKTEKAVPLEKVLNILNGWAKGEIWKP